MAANDDQLNSGIYLARGAETEPTDVVLCFAAPPPDWSCPVFADRSSVLTARVAILRYGYHLLNGKLELRNAAGARLITVEDLDNQYFCVGEQEWGRSTIV